MSLVENVKEELEQLAQKMLQDGSTMAAYQNLGILVRKDVPDFQAQYGSKVIFGEVSVAETTFVYLAN